VGVEVYVARTESFFRIVLDGAVPTELSDPEVVLEWDFYIDVDMNPDTGGAGTLLTNDIDPDYLLRLVMTSEWTVAEIYNLITNKSNAVEYMIKDNTISLVVPASVLPLEHFNFTAATCKWLATGELVAADKAPNQGHYNMPKGYVYIKPGLPTLKLSSTYNTVTVWYNEGNEERARWCAEAFEMAYSDVIDILHPPLPIPPYTLYVYASRVDLVEGLQIYSELSLDEALAYKDKGVPRPAVANTIVGGPHIFHIPPDFDWRAIYHQQVLDTMDRLC
jgi:hypothetical protein